MKLIVDISKYIYEHAKEKSEDSNDEWDAMRAIANGIPLPKGHDRLIEAKRLKEVFRRNTGYDYHDLIDNAPTIIEADKEG